ncbi:Protein SYM1 [Seminavis robusta]|uniref:Protein SYM1 n=1 Tax=Seminavis robusta TaxID=568900 RepID=A0A9N8DR76_9STRA|nr:Protein SYM1 [Seminavis robusta]|eukprot:Sro224_g091670.1 Protein SYM1 (273) ;mRNA; f:65339-66269
MMFVSAAVSTPRTVALKTSPSSVGRFQLSIRRCKASQAAGQAAVATSRSAPLGKRVWNAYTTALEKRPLTTKMTAAALIFFTSDSATQRLMDPEESYDIARASSGACFGVVATAYLHVWWGFLETTIGSLVPAARSRLLNTAVKVVIDQGCAAPLYVYSYYILTKSLQDISAQPDRSVGEILDESESRARHMLWPTMLQHWKLWPAVHSLNFYFVPIQHRVLVQNTVLVGWSGYLSHLNKTGLPVNDGKLITPKEEIESTIQRTKTEAPVKS